jgi:hypothetical protein
MWRIAIMALAVLITTMPVHAKPNKVKKHGNAQESVRKQQGDMDIRGRFSPAERNMIRAQLQQQERHKTQKKRKDLPPGLQKKVARGKALPPGWQKKIAAGESLNYQVYRQGRSLPEELLRRLPQSPIGSEILRIEDKIVRLNSATRIILDAFDLTPTR